MALWRWEVFEGLGAGEAMMMLMFVMMSFWFYFYFFFVVMDVFGWLGVVVVVVVVRTTLMAGFFGLVVLKMDVLGWEGVEVLWHSQRIVGGRNRIYGNFQQQCVCSKEKFGLERSVVSRGLVFRGRSSMLLKG